MRRARTWLAWIGGLAAITAAMIGVRGQLEKAHVALVYVMVVLAASSRAGRTLGLSLSVVAFLAFNFFFLPPYHTFIVSAAVDWLVLVAFLVTSLLAAQLLAKAQREAADARQRSTEIDRLSAVGAEALNAGRAEEALSAIADVIRTTLRVDRCEIYLRDDEDGSVRRAARSGDVDTAIDGAPAAGQRADSAPGAHVFALPTGARLIEWVAANGRTAIEYQEGGVRVSTGQTPGGHADIIPLDLAGARTIHVPLRVRDTSVGVLCVAHGSGLTLDLPQRRFLEALSYYAALGAERVRLVAKAEHAAALRRADELKDALLASVSHDLRTPLTTIKALAHDIRLEGDDRAIIIEEEADRLTRFVADLLDLSRLTGGAFAVALEVNAAEDLVGAALQRASSALAPFTVDVHLDHGEPLLLGRFDFVHSLRVLVNLLENAAKYSPAGSTIDVTVSRVEDRLEFAVADRGAGVVHGDEDRIFQPFYRSGAASPDAGGTGLGLSIARRMAEAQGGAVRHEARKGGGSTFVFSVPHAELADLENQGGESL